MKIFNVGDIVRELDEFTLGEVVKVDYNCGFDEVWVTFDDHLTSHCYGSSYLRLICPVYQRFDKGEHPNDFRRDDNKTDWKQKHDKLGRLWAYYTNEWQKTVEELENEISNLKKQIPTEAVIDKIALRFVDEAKKVLKLDR